MRSTTLALLLLSLLAFFTVASSPVCADVWPQTPIGPQYISANILWALILGLMLLFILYIGVGCIMDVERPVRMGSVPLQLSKEY